MTACDLDSSVPDWVVDHPETWALFQAWGVDYCCGGKSLRTACREQGLNPHEVLRLLLERLDGAAPAAPGAPSPPAVSPSAEIPPMPLHPARPNEAIDVRPSGAVQASTPGRTLFKTPTLEALQITLVAGKSLADHRAPGDISVHCLSGKLAFTAHGRTTELEAGRLVYLEAGEVHSVRCLEDASFLLTIARRS